MSNISNRTVNTVPTKNSGLFIAMKFSFCKQKGVTTHIFFPSFYCYGERMIMNLNMKQIPVSTIYMYVWLQECNQCHCSINLQLLQLRGMNKLA